MPPLDGHHFDQIALAEGLGLEFVHEFVKEEVELLLVLAFNDDLARVAAVAAGILGRGGLAGLGSGAVGPLGVQPIGLYLLESSHKIGFVSSKLFIGRRCTPMDADKFKYL
jgi:hypothetical protein